MKPPSYINHQGKQFFCVRKYRGVLSREAKRRVDEKKQDRAIARWHPPRDLAISQKRHMHKGTYWFGGPCANGQRPISFMKRVRENSDED